MRKFSDKEKRIIRELVSLDAQPDGTFVLVALLIDNLLVDPNSDLALAMRPSESAAYICFPGKDDEALQQPTEAVQHAVEEVITLYNLLQYLQREGKIVLVGNPTRSDRVIGLDEYIEARGGKVYGNGPVRTVKPPPSSMEPPPRFKIPPPFDRFAIESLERGILVTEDLKKLVERDFRTDEEVRHRRTFWLSVVAIIVSIAIGLWGVYSDIVLTGA